MSALAYILAKRKLPIYGSDIQRSHITQRLQDLGAEIFCHQQASNFEYVKQPQERGNKQPIGVELELSVAQNGVKTALAGVKVESLKGKDKTPQNYLKSFVRPPLVLEIWNIKPPRS